MNKSNIPLIDTIDKDELRKILKSFESIYGRVANDKNVMKLFGEDGRFVGFITGWLSQKRSMESK